MRKMNLLVLTMIFTMLVSVIGVSADNGFDLDQVAQDAIDWLVAEEMVGTYNYSVGNFQLDDGLTVQYKKEALEEYRDYRNEQGGNFDILGGLMNDFARYLKSLHEVAGIDAITYNDVVYEWNISLGHASKFADESGNTLVSAVVGDVVDKVIAAEFEYSDFGFDEIEFTINGEELSAKLESTEWEDILHVFSIEKFGLDYIIPKALDYEYDPAYEYGDVELENNVFTGTYTAEEFLEDQPMNDVARYLGALYRQEGSTIIEIEFAGETYTWNESGTLVGSNWEDENGNTLVSVLVETYTISPEPLKITISDGINTEDITFVLEVNLIDLINIADSQESLLYLLNEYNTILGIDLTTYNMLVEGRKTAVGNDLFANKPSEGFGTLEEFVLLFNNLVEFRVAVQEAVEAANDGELTIAHLGNVQVKLSELIDMKVNGQIVTAENLAEGNQFITLLGTLPTGRFSALVTDLQANGPYDSFTNMAMMKEKLLVFREAVQHAVNAANTETLAITHLEDVKNAIEPLDGMSLSGEMISYEMANDTIEQFKELSVETQNRILEKVAGEYPSFTHLLLAFPNAALSVALELVNEANNASELKLVVDDIFVYATGSSVENFNALNESEQMAVLSDIIANRPESGFNEVEEVVELFNAIIAIRMESSDVAEVAKASEGNITFNNTGLMLEGIVPNSFAAIEVYEGEVPAGVSSPAPNTLNLYAKITAQVADGNATFRAPIPLEADGYENFQLCRYNANSTWTCHDLEIEGNYFVLRNIEKFSWWALTGTPIPAPEPEQPTTPTGGAGPVFGGFFGSTEPSEQETPVVETPAEPDVPETPQEEVEQQIPETPATETPAAETPAAEMARGGPLTGLVTFAEENRGMFTGFSAIIMIGGILALVYYNTAGKRRYRRRY